MMTRGVLRSALTGVCLQVLTLLATAPASAADISQSRPMHAGQARVWFLREFDPALSFDTAKIYANGVTIGQSQPGTALPVDLAPGTYSFTVASDLPGGQQASIVELTAGAQVYFNVDANDWVNAGDQEQDHDRGTFDLRQMPVPLADEFFSALTVRPHN